jgi:hypothetical protein
MSSRRCLLVALLVTRRQAVDPDKITGAPARICTFWTAGLNTSASLTRAVQPQELASMKSRGNNRTNVFVAFPIRAVSQKT